MNILTLSRNLTIVAFLLSFLFHLSSILYVFSQKTYKQSLSNNEQDKLHIEEFHKQQPKQAPWVNTRARASNFGAPVFFEDEPEKALEKELEEIKANPPEDFSEEAKTIEPIKSPIDTFNKSDKQNTIIAQPTISSLPQSTSRQVTIPKKVQTNQTISKKALPKSNILNIPKPPLTLAQLTQGFLNQKKETAGSHGISMIGMKDGLPTAEQMKYERYLQKISWCLDNSMKINSNKYPPFAQQSPTYLFFVLNRDGMLQDLYVKKSCGNTSIDQFYVFIFRDASSSFPPLPSYLPDNPFKMTCVMY